MNHTSPNDNTPRRVAGLSIPYRGRARVLRCEQILATPVDELFPFFADARNLQAITPDFLDFRVVTEGDIEMKPGTIIDYRLRVRLLPIRWRTEITVWEPNRRFVDVQRRGPYRLWHHEHTFEPRPDGSTRCLDVVHYAHLGGPIVEKLFVRPDIEKIFDFRRRKLAERFGEVARPDAAPTTGRPALAG
ncbi:MAG: SRPBCC family protein [Phycisphaerales bacterium JB037]